MPSLEILLTFLATTAMFALIPGPAMLYSAARTLAGGRWSGLMASLGIHLGGYVHVVAAAAGLSLIFHAAPVLYVAVKLFGAAYLVWLGISLFRSKAEEDLSPFGPLSGRRAFAESVTVEVLNPKAAIFYLAFLPQFVDTAASFPVWVQFVLLGAVVNVMFSVADLVAVALADIVRAKLRRSSAAQRAMQRAGGAILLGLGAHLAARVG